ncbi:MAG: Stk1 family PASTA domain-containing Ser/Thr kinase [Bacillota bacterium]
MIGKVLGGRYEIVEKLGAGGMSLVYKGMDTLLNRAVTIKVLRDQYASDDDFVRRFRREAQAVASLSHPNIVSIYDVGRENEMHYLVMEYIQGRTLKEIISEQGPLETRRAMEMTIQICDALEHAHVNHVIHRDIKPQNILITPSGRVKVTDFGIARDTSSTLTYTATIVGSVHYISPEQAKGEVSTEKSDLYAVGVVLYEMITSELPFKGDSPISIALKQIQEDPLWPRALNPEVSPALEKVVMRAMEKDPALRYDTASEIAADLRSLMAIEPESGLRARKKKNKRVIPGRRRLRPAGRVLLVASVLLAIFALYFGMVKFIVVPETQVPGVEAKPLAEAEEMLRAAGLVAKIGQRMNDPTVPLDYVISQTPKSGDRVRRGRVVELDVSNGPSLQKVPRVVGMTERLAEIELNNNGFVVGERQRVYDPKASRGIVIDQNPKNDEPMPEGTAVELVISEGPEPQYIPMPDLRGLTLEDARKNLENNMLELGMVTYGDSREYFSGQVKSQDILPKELILQGHTVNLVISKGPGPSAKWATVTYPVPDDGQAHQIQIVVVDAKGRHEEYNQTNMAGEIVRQQVPFYGQGKIEIYMDSQMDLQKVVQ